MRWREGRESNSNFMSIANMAMKNGRTSVFAKFYIAWHQRWNLQKGKSEAELPSGNRIFTAVIDGIYHLVVFGENTLIYAYSPDSLDEINEILIQLGYLDGR